MKPSGRLKKAAAWPQQQARSFRAGDTPQELWNWVAGAEAIVIKYSDHSPCIVAEKPLRRAALRSWVNDLCWKTCIRTRVYSLNSYVPVPSLPLMEIHLYLFDCD